MLEIPLPKHKDLSFIGYVTMNQLARVYSIF